mmetsp:Transcript_108065/g.149329  ORF Transcript_108065/g.149329 Transcript_108065/m.149329 type:complete len:114 (-) Transcript_108065:36-377(-)
MAGKGSRPPTPGQEKLPLDFGVLSKKLDETGEKEKLKEYIKQTLAESGWREEMKKHCVEHIQNKGVEKVTLEDITAEIAPRGRATLPDNLKTDLLNKLRAFAETQGMQTEPAG